MVAFRLLATMTVHAKLDSGVTVSQEQDTFPVIHYNTG